MCLVTTEKVVMVLDIIIVAELLNDFIKEEVYIFIIKVLYESKE